MAQECTYMSDTVFLLCPDLKKKKEGKKEKKSTYRPSRFSGQKGKRTFYFLGLRSECTNNVTLSQNDSNIAALYTDYFLK